MSIFSFIIESRPRFMYTNFFSLSELPFSIAPDPKYLFMSDRHREALTHLTHGLGGAGVSSNGGFVLLTGEVGTGKTTVSRCLMADLPEDTQLAFILNPTLSSQELLASICDQLKIRYRKTGATLKTLTDKISEKLLKNHANNINTLLIIDEAQHLEPKVLEQLRLLTNLETNTQKLLQVILIGQPELQQLLKRRDLRQLAQRITARYHILPLDKSELGLYIKHRLSVADCHRALFNKGALAAIHQLSQGIPRVINLICHSALMEAYNSNNAVVDKKIVYKAAYNALGEDFLPVAWWQHKSAKLTFFTSILLVVLLAGFWLGKKEPLISPMNVLASAPREEMQTDKAVNNKAMSPTFAEQKSVANILATEESQDLKQISFEESTVAEEAVQVVKGKNKIAKLTTEALIAKEPEQKIISAQRKLNTTQETKKDGDYKVEAVEGVSDDLLARFQAAMDETKEQTALPPKPEETSEIPNDISPLTQMPAWVQNGVPTLRFEQHIYASDGQGWVNVNGRDRYEGDMISPELELKTILPQQVILKFKGEEFSLPALTNW